MNKGNMKNERLKRQYFQWLKGTEGLSESTLLSIEKGIWTYETYLNYRDLSELNAQAVIRFCEWLKSGARNGQGFSLQNQNQMLRILRKFFQWLSSQSAYRKSIKFTDIAYFRLNRKELNQIATSLPVDHPSLEYVRKLTDSIEPLTDIDRRDRALIAFLFLSGLRDRAVASLPFGCIDPDKQEVRQLPQAGVHTKFGKVMITFLFPFDDRLLGYVLDWYSYLRQELLFTSGDPFFPKSEVHFNPDTRLFETKGIGRNFWSGSGPIRSILRARTEAAGLKYFHPHLYRHGASLLALQHAKTPEEMKAVSQNLGHESVSTTLTSYCRLDHFRVEHLVKNLNPFGDTDETQDSELLRDLQNLIRKSKRKP